MTEIIGRLNGIQAEPGTMLGLDGETLRFTAVAAEDSEGCTIRYATPEETKPQAFKHAPRSVAEHHAIPRRMSPYGFIRRFTPTPVKAQVIKRHGKRIVTNG